MAHGLAVATATGSVRMNAGDPRLAEAVAALRRGELVGMPTETVYGLAGDAGNPAAVRKIFELKGRPADHPLIVHVAGAEALADWCANVPEAARRLAAEFWPGPLTLILPRAAHVSDLVTGGQDTVGLRCPAHPLAQALLHGFGGGLAAPSANRFGHVSPTSAAHVRAEFGDALPIVLDGGDCTVGIESTILDLSGRSPRILRPGMLSRERIEAVIGPVVAEAGADSPRVSGSLDRHYAPRTAAWLLPRAALAATASEQSALGQKVLLLAFAALPEGCEGLALPADPAGYAHGLYAALRALDERGANLLLVERPPGGEDWLPLHDRLRRAVAGAGEDEDAP
jgi:L-threonylcarbamoyladenylate synthase